MILISKKVEKGRDNFLNPRDIKGIKVWTIGPRERVKGKRERFLI